MKRRTFLQMSIPVAAGLLLPACTRIEGSVEKQVLPIVLRGGRSFYQGRWQTMDVGIDDAGRLRFGTDLRGTETLNVSGRVVSPGFIDILADNSTSPETTYSIFEKYKVSDGVTTALQMHGGSADCGCLLPAVCASASLDQLRCLNFRDGDSSARRRCATSRKEPRRRSARRFAQSRISARAICGDAGVCKAGEEIRASIVFALALLVERERTGRSGRSDSSRERQRVRAFTSIIFTRLAELFTWSRRWRRFARQTLRGLTITTCVYPYSYWATYLSNNRFGAGWQQRYGLSYNDLRIVGSSERLTARTFAHYRKTSQLAAVPEGTMPLDKTVDLALKEDFCMIGSDGGIQFEPRANSHPRGAGCFATAIRHALDIGIPLEKILEKMTSLPRSVVQPCVERSWRA